VPTKRLLVVEDEVLVARDIKARLTRMGYEVLAIATRGAEAIAKALLLRPDLVLMDINLRDDIDGIQAAIEIRSQYDVPVIFCTAYSNEATLVRAKVSEPYGYVLKPFDNRELEINIEIALYKHRAEKDLSESRRRLDATLSNVSDGVIAAQSDGQILFINPVAQKLTGWCQQEAQASSLFEVLVLLPFAPGESVLDLTKLAMDQPQQPSLRLRHLIQAADGGITPVEIAVNIQLNNDPGLIVITLRDLHQQLLYEEEIRRNAFYDSLTGLPNRLLFLDHLKSALYRRRQADQDTFAVAFVGLDGFSVINEGLGHDHGDQVLREIARRISTQVRPEDTVSRFSGDLFAVLLDPVNTASGAIEACQQLQQAIMPSLVIGNNSLELSSSIGIVLYHEGYQTPDAIIRDADTALHRAKRGAKGSYMMFDTHMHETALNFIRLKSHMQQALNDEDFEVYYQPIVDCRTEKMVSLEALLRWQHPARGLVAPGDFIPIAEQTGLIRPLGRLVLRSVCRQIRNWSEQGFGGFQVAVNLSAKQFESDLVRTVQDIILETDISPLMLGVEITEGVAMQNIEQNILMLQALRDLGLTVSIDDFGTGHSSLAYLKRLPLNTLKIDQSFIQDIAINTDDREITRAIIDLGHNLNLKVLAEGVETTEQLQFLRSCDCDYVQGYYYSEPLPAAAMSAYLRCQLAYGSKVPPSTSRVVPVI
jgi:diguanylate cyclase (GGDEF)-like protein/PAS domain S-box-containing protein